MNDLLMEPLKYYEEQVQEQYRQNTIAYFEDLVKKSGINVDANHKTVKEYKDELENINKLKGKLSKFSGLRIFLVIAAIVGIIVAVASIWQFSSSVATGIVMLVLGIAVAGITIYFWFAKVNKIIKDSNSILEKHNQKAADLLEEAKVQMAPLNSLFDDKDSFRIFEKTVPEFKFNNKFTPEHEDLMISKNDFVEFLDVNNSVTDTLAGTFCNNPFLYYRYNTHTMGTQTYHGELYITWTETYRDSDGNLRTRSCSQTLHAEVTKPKPFYDNRTLLAYGCQAAPDLTFSRKPTHSERLSEKELAKVVKKGEKELQKKARKATAQGGNFQEMANAEFDVLFGANDRDNEVQFRLMYTPLAQRNTVALIKNKVGFGDDFHFVKERRCTTVATEHSQKWDMNTSADFYKSYDVEDAKTKFLNRNFEFFHSVYFDFAPLMSVPAYLESPVPSMEDPRKYERNYTTFEHETLANFLGASTFAAPDTATDTILKTKFVSKNDDTDIVEVNAYSYATEPRIDYVPVFGGDKRFHNVPVHWIEYIPLVKTSNMAVKALDMSEREFKNSNVALPEKGAYAHGLLAYLLNN